MSEIGVISLILIIGFVVVILFIWTQLKDLKNKSSQSQEIVEWLKNVSTRLESSNDKIDKRLDATMTDFNRRLDSASVVMSHVQKSIGEFSEIGRSMVDLQNLLKSPKLRGGVGEHILASLLEEFLPHSMYKAQYTFSDGAKVDFVIKTQRGLIPIDSKFPAENYQKYSATHNEDEQKKYRQLFVTDVKTHIKSIGEKYVRPAEGTIDYAIMYIPSESVYYEMISGSEMYEFSRKHRVLLVSPMSFYAYLRVLLVSFEGEKIEEKAKEILTNLRSLKSDYERTDKALNLLQKHMTNAYNQLALVTRSFLNFGQKLDSTKLLGDKSEKISDNSIDD